MFFVVMRLPWTLSSELAWEKSNRLAGRLFVVTGTETLQEASLVKRVRENEWERRPLFETSIEALEHAPRPEAFGF